MSLTTNWLSTSFWRTLSSQLALSGTPSATQHWFESTLVVTVTDGRLSIGNGTGAVNDKINYVDVSNA